MAFFTWRLWWNVVKAYDFDKSSEWLVAHMTDRREQEREHLSRIRWQELNRAERAFPCGFALVPETEGALPVMVPPPPPAGGEGSGGGHQPPTPVPPATVAPPLTRTAQVTAAVLQDDLVFLIEDGVGEVEEAGRLPRTAITAVDVRDAYDVHVPDPIRETIEPPQLVFATLNWSNDGALDEERFAFQSPWMAWRAAHKLLEAKRG